jgi:hypothetical protein
VGELNDLDRARPRGGNSCVLKIELYGNMTGIYCVIGYFVQMMKENPGHIPIDLTLDNNSAAGTIRLECSNFPPPPPQDPKADPSDNPGLV